MGFDAWFTAGLTAAVVVLFVLERFPPAQVAAAVPVALLLAGVLDAEQALAGLSHHGTVTVAAMLVLSLGLVKTGAVEAIGRWARRASLGGPRARLLVLCLAVALLSPFLNNTAVVVIFLPVFLALAGAAGEPPSRYLIPLSYSAILGGTVTLLGTSTNLIVYGMARRRGLDDLHLFSIAPLGLVYLATGLAYVFTVGRRLLPSRPPEVDLSAKYRVRSFGTELEVAEDSPVVGKEPEDLGWQDRYEVTLVGVERGGVRAWGRRAAGPLRAGDVLLVQGQTDRLLELARKEKLENPAQRKHAQLDEGSQRLVEVLVTQRSPLAGRTLNEIRFRRRYGATVLAIQRHGTTLGTRLGDVRVHVGDLLLVNGTTAALEALAENPGFAPLGEVTGRATRPRILVSVLILAAVVLAAGSGAVSILVAALGGVLAMLFTGCVHLDEVYAELDWQVVFVLAGLLPLGLALEETGLAQQVAHGLAGAIEGLPPGVAVAAFYLLTSLLTEILSNAAAAVLVTPVAIAAAAELGLNPYALLVAVMFGASASFMTPVGYQTNLLVYGPGGYRYTDFLKVGAPLNLLLLLVAACLIPLLWG